MPDGSLFDLVATVTAMRAHRSWLHYVGLATSRTVKHAQLVLSKYQVRVHSVTADVGGRGPFVAAAGAGAGAATSIACADVAHRAALLALEAKGCAAWDAGGDGGEGNGGERGGNGGERSDAHAAAAAAHAWPAFAPAEAGGGSEEAAGADTPARVRLMPLVQWYDTTHVASTWYYRRFVFDRRARRVAKGGFIEDKV